VFTDYAAPQSYPSKCIEVQFQCCTLKSYQCAALHMQALDLKTHMSKALWLFVPRTSTNCATGLLWSTWEALITMQHNPAQKDTLRRVLCLL